MTQPINSNDVSVNGMDVINDLAAQLGTALRDLAIARAQINVLKANPQPVPDKTV